MGRNRYGVMGAIAAILVWLGAGLLPALGQGSELGLAPDPAAFSIPIEASPQLTFSPATHHAAEQNKAANAVSPEDDLEQGKLAYQNGHFAEAIQFFSRAAQLSPAFDQSQALSYLSLAQQQQGEWAAAQRSVSQGLAIAQSLAASRPQQLLLGRAFNAQGSLYFFRGKAEAALEAWQQAETAYGAAKDRTRQLGSLLNQAQAWQSLGYYGRSRRTLEDIRQRLAQEPLALRLVGLRSLGNMYWRIGELEQSKIVLRQAASLAKDAQDTAQQSAILLSLGNTEQAQGNREAALQHYQQAAGLGVGEVALQATLNRFRLLVIAQRRETAQQLIPVLQNQIEVLPVSRAVLYGATNFADCLTQLAFPKPIGSHTPVEPQTKGTAQSKAWFRSWKVTLRSGLEVPQEDEPVLGSATVSSAAQQARLAADILSWVVKTAQSLGDIRASAYGQGYLGHLYELSQQWKTALDLTQQAIAQTEQIQARDIGYQWQWQAARIYRAQQRLKDAKEAYHKSFDMLQSLRSDLVAAQPDLQFSFREQVAPVYREFVDLLLQLNEAEAPKRGPASESLLQLARQVLESLQIAELNNFFNAACIQDQIVALDDIERKDTAVLYPIILPDRLTVIWSLPGEPLHSHTTAVDQSQVEQTLKVLRANLERNYTSPQGKQAGEAVYNWLIRPLAATLQENHIKTLTFVLDGPLRNVPMAALYDRGQKRYLVQDYSIALTPGLQLFEPEPLRLRQGKTLLAGLSEARNALSALPHVEEELRQISRIVPSEVLLNRAFTRAALEKNVRTSAFSVVHLATHGEFSSDSEQTYVSAWDERVKVTQLSAALRGRDRPDPIELLVLSACKTAQGDDRAALGLAGIAVQAGARSTVASLWNVDDESSSKFMQEFYAALNQDMTRAEALRKAQLVLLKQPNYRHPASWASYVLVGSWL